MVPYTTFPVQSRTVSDTNVTSASAFASRVKVTEELTTIDDGDVSTAQYVENFSEELTSPLV
jgi:hypothetical protein